MRITLWGMYEYDGTLFGAPELPQGAVLQDLIDLIMERSGDLYPYYQALPPLKRNIARWFRTRRTSFNYMWDALHAEYNPIHNYDRTEEHTTHTQDSGTDTRTLQLSGTDTVTGQLSGTDTLTSQDSGQDKTTQTSTSSGTSNTTGNQVTGVSAYDADGFQNREKIDSMSDTDTSGSSSLTETLEKGTGRKDTTDYGKKDVTETDYGRKDTDTNQYGKEVDGKEDIRAFGNIGVTTTQQMIEAEIQMRRTLEWYEVVAQMFEDDFLVQVY